MRIVHTSDWHAGRVWRGVNRLPELQDVLENLGDFVERERIDLLLLSGDVFDSGAPPPQAEAAVFGFLKRVGQAGTQSVVIAGNHDSAARLEAWGSLAELVGVRALGRPQPAQRGGIVELESCSGERAVVAAVPFAPPRTLVTALDLAEDDTKLRQRYADGMHRIVESLSARFRTDAVNLMMLHTHVEGALLSGSERRAHIGEEWAAAPEALPAGADYVALGHIHRPQRMEAAPAPAFYAGSPLQLDFGETGEEKSFVLVDARPGQPARCERIPYRGGQQLRQVTGTVIDLERDADTLRSQGWLEVRVALTSPDADVGLRVRRLLPNAVKVRVESPLVRGLQQPPERPPTTAGARELFAAYFRRQHGRDPETALLAAFEQLHDEGALG